MRSKLLVLQLFTLCYLLTIGALNVANAQRSKLFKKKQPNEKKIKIALRWEYAIKNNQPASEGYLAAETAYQINGEPSKYQMYSIDGTVKYSYQYKKDGNTQLRYWEHEGTVIVDSREELDALGNVIKHIRYQPDGKILDIKMMDYNAKGRIVKEVYFDNANQRVYEIIISYNEAQHSLTERYHDFLNKEEYMIAVELDDDYQPLIRTRYKKSGPLVDKTIYKRDQQGRLLEKQVYDVNKKMVLQEQFVYDDDEGKMNCSIFKAAKLLAHYVYEYKYY